MNTLTCKYGALIIEVGACQGVGQTCKIYPPFKFYPHDNGGYFLYGSDGKTKHLPEGDYLLQPLGEQHTLEEVVDLIESGQFCSTGLCDFSSLVSCDLSGDANADNTIIALASVRADTGLSVVNNEIVNSIGGSYVKVSANSFFEEPSAGFLSGVSPVMELLKNGSVVAISATGYQRHGSGNNSSSNTICYTDPNPQIADVYSLRSQRGSTQTDVMPIDLGSFSVTVVDKK